MNVAKCNAQRYMLIRFCPTKGQLFFKCPSGVFKSSEKQKIYVRVSFLASKKRSNQIIRAHIGWFYFDSLTLLFWWYLFLEARQKSLKKSIFNILRPSLHFEYVSSAWSSFYQVVLVAKVLEYMYRTLLVANNSNSYLTLFDMLSLDIIK